MCEVRLGWVWVVLFGFRTTTGALAGQVSRHPQANPLFHGSRELADKHESREIDYTAHVI